MEEASASLSGPASPATFEQAELPDLAFAVALASLPGFGPVALRNELSEAPSARVAFERRGGSPARAAACWARLSRSGIAVLRPGDAGFPPRLAADPECPALLFVRGSLPAPELPSVAIIGTRTCTLDGAAIAGELAAALAEAGVVVVSGLALGIDQAAHCAVLRPGGSGARPLAVVGGGVDVVYPRGSGRLLEQMARCGAVLSEAPPGTRPERWRFPLRNRLIAALSDVVLVVESHRRGGSLVTVEAALRRGVAVAAVPGSVRSPASQGCNDLLADGAHVVRDADDLLALLGLVSRSAAAAPSLPASFVPGELELLAAATPSGATPSGATPSGSTPSGSTPSGSTPPAVSPPGSTPSGSTLWGPTPPGVGPSRQAPSRSAGTGTSSAGSSAPAAAPPAPAALGSGHSGAATRRSPAPRPATQLPSTSLERSVLAALEWRPLSLAEVLRRVEEPLGKTVSALTALAAKGLVEPVGVGWQRATCPRRASR